MPLSISVATGRTALEQLDGRWDALLRRQPVPNPLLSSTWLRALAGWEAGTPLVVLAEADGELLAGAAVGVRRAGRGFGPTVATWLGPTEQLSYLDILANPKRPEAGEAVVAALLDETGALSIRTPASGAAAGALAAVAPWRSKTPAFARWLLACPPPRLDYVREQAAKDVRRAERRGGHVEVRIHTEPDDVASALARFFRVHRERWRGRSDELSRFATTHALRRWNMQAITALAADGRVHLVEVVENGGTVACELELLHGGGALSRVRAVRTGGALRQPGHLAALTAAEAVAQAGATVIDLGCGNDGPGGSKLRFGPEPDPLLILFAARSPARQRRYEALQRVRHATRTLT